MTTTVTLSLTETSGTSSTVAPTRSDRLATVSSLTPCAAAIKTDASGTVLTISSSRFTLAGVTRSVE